MKLLIIATSKFEMDGITGSIMNYYRYMDKTDMTIDFVLPNELPNYLQDDIVEDKTKIHVLPMKLRKKRPISYILKLKKIIKEGNYDIVHAHGSSAILFLEMYAAKLARCPIRIAHSRNTKCDHPIVDKILRPFFYQNYTHGFACGKKAGEWLFPKRKFTIITNGNDIQKNQYNKQIREEYRKKYNLDDKKVIGHVGNFNYQKNHEFLIEIFDQLVKLDDSYYLVLIGENRVNGKIKEEIEQKVKEKGLSQKVLFVGKTPEVAKWIQAMDIMVFPSRFEGLPNVVIEWQIACLPCVISSEITEEVQLTDLVKFMSLKDKPEKWAEEINNIKIINRETIKNKTIDEIREKGFDVKENAKFLKETYQELIRSKE